MSRPSGTVISAALRAAAVLGLLAAASPGYAQQGPDPGLARASRAQLQDHIQRGCLSVQARLAGTSPEALQPLCGCYASRTIRSFDRLELSNYRTRGVFDDTGRLKALRAIDRCGLKRPPNFG